MQDLIKQAEELKIAIARKAKEIDNPVLVMSIVTELDNFIYNLVEE